MTTPIVGGEKPQDSLRRYCSAIGLLALGVVAAACTSNGGSELVPAADAAVSVTFDADSCRWEGPTLIEQGTIEISLINAADVDVFFAGFAMQEPALSMELERTPMGSDKEVVNQREAFPNGDMVFGWWVSPGDPVDRSQPFPAGLYLLDCLTGGPFDHSWRAADIEIALP